MKPIEKEVFLHEMAKKEKIKELKKAISKLQILYLSTKSNITERKPQTPEIELQSIASSLIFALWQYLNSSILFLYGDYFRQSFVISKVSKGKVDRDSPEFAAALQNCIWALPGRNPAFKCGSNHLLTSQLHSSF